MMPREEDVKIPRETILAIRGHDKLGADAFSIMLSLAQIQDLT
jgi:hypothetical protein